MSGINTQFLYDFTDRYAEWLNPLASVNSLRELMRLVPPKHRAGRQMRFPIQTGFSHGQTPNLTGNAFTLNAALSPSEEECIIDGADIVMREVIPYSAMLKGRNGASKDGQSAAYWEPFDKVMWSLGAGADHYAEVALGYGCGSGTTILGDVGVVATTAVLAGTGPNYGSATHPIVQFTRASWMAGFWLNMKGSLVDIVNSAGTDVLVKDVLIEGVGDPALCQVQMFKSGSVVAVAAGHRVVPKDWAGLSVAAVSGQTCTGVSGILRNTGTFANINAATNNFWRPRQFNAGAAKMTRARVLGIAAKLYPNGGKDGLTCKVSGPTFADLAEEPQAATRWVDGTDGGIKTKVQGTNKLQYLTPVGTFNIELYEYQKQGEMWFLEPETAVRVGASDITFRGIDDGQILLEIPDVAGSELRCMAQQAPLLKVPAHCAVAYGIANDNDDTSGS